MDNVDNAINAGVQEQAPIADTSTQVGESAPATEAPQQDTAAPVEKMIPQSQVSKIAAREAREAAAKAEAKMRSEYEAKFSQFQSQQSQSQDQSQNIGGIQQQTPEQIRNLIRQEAFEMSQKHQAESIEKDWLTAMNAEKMADPDFADLYDELGIEEHPELIIWMKGMDNKAQVVRELGNNPSKYFNLLIAKNASPRMAQKELAKLSASIKANQDALKQPKVDAPLSQLKPSNIGGDDGNLTVADYMKMFRG